MYAAAGRSSPIHLLASKPLVGHSEPAAGLTGLAYAAHQLAGRLAAPLLHLRSLNPHVESVLSSKGLPAGSLALPMACAPLADAGSTEGMAMGVSAFAFQVCVGLRSESGLGNNRIDNRTNITP